MMSQLIDKDKVLFTIASFQTSYRKEHKVEDIYEAVNALPIEQPDNTCHGCRYEEAHKTYNAPCVSCARWFTDWYERRSDERFD